MIGRLIATIVCLGLLGSTAALAGDEETAIASAESAAPTSVTAGATIKALDGTVLRKGSNNYTCYPQQKMMGPMCNDETWDAQDPVYVMWGHTPYAHIMVRISEE
jgi:hypothetical protein